MSAGLSQCAVPTSIHCDHLIQAINGAESDLKVRSVLGIALVTHEKDTSGRLLPIKKCSISLKVLLASTVSNSGNRAPVLFTRSYSRTMLLQEYSCECIRVACAL